MALTCPSCNEPLSALKLREEFACPSCGKQLRGHTTRAFAICLGLWLAADFLLMVILGASVPTDGLALALRIILSAIVGLALCAWGLPAWSRVEPRA
jgi:hypothetical protein